MDIAVSLCIDLSLATISIKLVTQLFEISMGIIVPITVKLGPVF